jgi:hypothetical protein
MSSSIKHRATDQLELKVNPNVSQSTFTKNARNVYVSVQITKIGDIDTMNDRYQGVFEIESRWIDDELIQKYEPSKHWNPRIYIENIFQDINEEIKYEIVERIFQSKQTIVVEKRKAKG